MDRVYQLYLDGKLAQELKVQGLDTVEESHLPFVQRMRHVAIRIAGYRGWVTSDDLRAYAALNGLAPAHSNAWGAVFRGPQWKVIGRCKSAVPENHHRTICVWQYEPA